MLRIKFIFLNYDAILSLLLHAACTHLKHPHNYRSFWVSLWPVQEGPAFITLAVLITRLFSCNQSALCQSSKIRSWITKCLNYAKLSFMNSDHKQVTCVCYTVNHVRLETPQLLADCFCLCLQTEGKGQSNVVGHFDRGFVCRLSKSKGPKDPPLSVLTAAFHLMKQTYLRNAAFLLP
jgi:hypothetical protein